VHIWTDIVAREFVMLLTLTALGIGPAAFLGRRFDSAARLAMAPVLGLCVGACLFTTVIWFSAASHSYWLLPVAALVSTGIAVWRGFANLPESNRGRRPLSKIWLLVRKLRIRDAVMLAVVCVVVAAPLSYTLRERHSVGPTGFEVWDALAFTAEADGAIAEPIHTAEHKENLFGQNLAQMYWAGTLAHEQQIDATPLAANTDSLLGLYATDTQTLFMIAFLVAGALGAFAAVRYAAPKPSWIALFAGLLFAGPFFLQLISDGSQPATSGLATILPIVAVGFDTLRDPRLASLALFALLIAGVMALYPLFVPAIALSAAAVLIVVAVGAWWRGSLTRRRLLIGLGCVGTVIALSIVFNIVSFLRDVRYWRTVLEGGYYLSSLPKYHLPYSVIPGWLLQTREFYNLTELGSTSAGEVLIGVILPGLFIGIIVFGLKRHRLGLILALIVVVFAAMGMYTSAKHGCSYCTDRTLLPIAPLSIGLLAVGIAALVTASSWWLRWIGIAVALIAIVSVAQRTRTERVRFSNGAFFLEASERALVSKLPKHAGPLYLEGFGQDLRRAPGELPIVYLLAWERNHGEVSIISEYTDYGGLGYFTNADPANPQFSPRYRYVLTRFGGVETGRRLISRKGSVALEERTGPLDATVVSGVAVPLERLNTEGLSWVQGPVRVDVVGVTRGPAWVSLRFRAAVPVSIPSQAGVRARIGGNGLVSVCVRAVGSVPLRKASVTLSFPLAPGIVPAEEFAVQEPPQGVQLIGVRAGTSCSL
jgi:hypothetical protein